MDIKIVKNSFISTLVISSVVMGFILVKQAGAAVSSREVSSEDNIMKLAYEIIEISNSNFNLQKEINRLRVKNDSFSLDIRDRSKISEDMEKKLQNYRVMNGAEPVNGRGVEIEVSGNMLTEEFVDLINGIRNVKPNGIGINGERVIYRSYFVTNDNKAEFDGHKFDMPIRVQVIGDPEVLKKSLDRSGGILDVLKRNSFEKIQFKIEARDNISLPAYSKKIEFRYAKTSN